MDRTWQAAEGFRQEEWQVQRKKVIPNDCGTVFEHRKLGKILGRRAQTAGW